MGVTSTPYWAEACSCPRGCPGPCRFPAVEKWGITQVQTSLPGSFLRVPFRLGQEHRNCQPAATRAKNAQPIDLEKLMPPNGFKCQSAIRTGEKSKQFRRSNIVSAEVQPMASMPEVGVEPTRPEGHWILSPARLPFRHSGRFFSECGLPCAASGDHHIWLQRFQTSHPRQFRLSPLA